MQTYSDYIEKQDPTVCCLQGTHFKHKWMNILKLKKKKQNNKWKKAGMFLWISEQSRLQDE